MPAAEIDQIMVPNAVIPFSVSKEQTQELFINFAKKKRLVNKNVFDCKLEQVVGFYVPYWTFDTYTASFYYAYRDLGTAGYDHINGNWYQYIDDVAIFASERLCHPFIKRIQKFDFKKAVPYSPEYLAGIPAERYTLGLDYCWERSKEQITRKLKKDIHLADRRQDVDWIKTNYYNVKFRCLLAPMYFGSFKYRKTTYHIAINGQTGKTLFTVPRYFGQMIIVAAIASILTLVGYFALMYLFPDSPLMWFYRFIYGG